MVVHIDLRKISANETDTQRLALLVFAATEPNLLTYRFTAATSYCFQPAVQGFAARGSTNVTNVKCWMPLGAGADFGPFSEAAATFDVSAPVANLNVPARTTPLHGVLY